MHKRFFKDLIISQVRKNDYLFSYSFVAKQKVKIHMKVNINARFLSEDLESRDY